MQTNTTSQIQRPLAAIIMAAGKGTRMNDPSKAKVIGEKIISEELNGSVYNEEDAKHWSLNISDKVREAVNGIQKFLLFAVVFITLFFISQKV